jgi:phosphatidylglycerol---prolipoprotein diacylglyceryl transferase
VPVLALPFPAIDPVLIQIGPFAIRWYALAYIAGLVIGWQYVKRLVQRPGWRLTPSDVDDLLVYVTLGVVIGGRLGYILFYRSGFYLSHPLEALAVWHGGMSFHGGALGVLAAALIFARLRQRSALEIVDAVCAAGPLGLFFGRIANFINGELFGRVTDVPWAMVFPHGGDLPRHPSQLYEAALEGVLLFGVAAARARRGRPADRYLPDRLRCGALVRRAVPRAGPPSRLPVRGLHHGAAAVAANDPARGAADHAQLRPGAGRP